MIKKSRYGYKLLRKLRQANIKVSFKDKNFLDKLSNFNKHQGIIASIKSFEYSSLNEIIQNAKKKQYPFPLCFIKFLSY